MKTVEMRFPLPMTVDEYFVAQQWAVNEQSKRETGGGEGVEILKNEPFENVPFMGGKYSKGQYTYKIYHVETKVPKVIRTLLKPIIGKKGFQLHEEAWNAYPYCKTVLTNPAYMKDNFKVILESIHLPGNGNIQNALDLTDAERSKIPVQMVDIIADNSNLRDKSMDPVAFRSVKSGRGPLDPKTWTQTTQPIMTCYKFITIHFKWFGLQTAMESAMMEQYRKMLLAFHQQVWCWTDDWYGLTIEDVRRMEFEAQEELKRQIQEQEKRGTKDFD